jgi:hypothetical protein
VAAPVLHEVRPPGYRPIVLRSLCTLVIGGVVSGFAFLLLTGRYINDGPIVATVSGDHGVHEGDLFVVAGWVAAMLALAWLVVVSGRREPAASGTTR